MKVTRPAPTAATTAARTPATLGRTVTASTIALAIALAMLPAPASAITRDTVIGRANTWIRKGVRYSQSGFADGYRRDCSGMVSMAWKLPASYTTRTISRRAVRIPVSALQRGDAVLTPGHVAVFERWKSKRAGTFVALEQSGRGKPAQRRVKTLRRGAVGLRLRGITDVEPLPSIDPSATVPADGSDAASLTADPSVAVLGAFAPIAVGPIVP